MAPENLWKDPPARRISFAEWGKLFLKVPDELLDCYHYFRADQEKHGGPARWSAYMFPPQQFAVYGCRHLKRLKYDNSLAALRLWGFVQNETERLFRARQLGRKVVACLGDLGAVPVIVNSFPGVTAFYPDCLWWTPFVMESKVLFEAAAELGIGEATCYSRAALGAFAKHAYFPDPDLCIASSGASCDDYAAVEQLAAAFARDIIWAEEPVRPAHISDKPDPESVAFLVQEYRRIVKRLEELTGHHLSEKELHQGILKANRIRRLTAHLRELAYGQGLLPALEMMIVEFGCLHHYSDIDEWTEILVHLAETAERRKENGEAVTPADALRIVWVTPPADPLFLCYFEDAGCRIVGTEYVINQALEIIAEDKPPLEAIAESFLAASLIGTTRQRSESVIAQARSRQADGVVISGIFGGSHCAMETRLISHYVREALGLPVLEFDVPDPAPEISQQLRTRIEAFLEVLTERRIAGR